MADAVFYQIFPDRFARSGRVTGLNLQPWGDTPHFHKYMGGDLWGEHADYVTSLRALVKAKNLQDRFNFVPHQSNNVEALSAFDAIVLPSREEPFGRVPIEGMALGKVVIAFAVNGPTEIVTHEHDGLLVAPDAADGLAHAMKRALQGSSHCESW